MADIIDFTSRTKRGGDVPTNARSRRRGGDGGTKHVGFNDTQDGDMCRKCRSSFKLEDWHVALDNVTRSKSPGGISGHLVCPECAEIQEDTILSRISTVTEHGLLINVPFDLIRNRTFVFDPEKLCLDLRTLLIETANALTYKRFKKNLEDYLND